MWNRVAVFTQLDFASDTTLIEVVYVVWIGPIYTSLVHMIKNGIVNQGHVHLYDATILQKLCF